MQQPEQQQLRMQPEQQPERRLQQQEPEQQPEQQFQQPFRHKRSRKEPTGQQPEQSVSFVFL